MCIRDRYGRKLNNFIAAVFIFWRSGGNFRCANGKESFAVRRLFGYLTGTKMKPFIHLKIWPATVGTLLIIAATGCGRDSVKVYHVDASDNATPTPPPIAAPAAMPGSMPEGMLAPDNSSQPPLQYTLS